MNCLKKVITLVLICVLVFFSSCKKGPYVAGDGDIITLTASALTIKIGDTILITITGIKANGRPMPDETLVRVSADSGSFTNEAGNPVQAVLLMSGKALVTYISDPNFTGDAVNITAQCGSAQINPEALVITIEKVVVEENVPPIAAFTFSPTNPKSGETIHFNAEASTDPDGEITEYRWNFGDSNQDIVTNVPSTTYSYSVKEEKTFVVTLTVTDNDHATNVISIEVTVSPKDNQGPLADFVIETDNPKSGEPVSFRSTSKDDGDIVSYAWDFGDGGTSAARNPVHIYTVEVKTTFVVSLTVVDDQGLSDIANKPVTIDVEGGIHGPTAVFDYSPKTPKAGQTVYFTNESTSPDDLTLTYEWNFGDSAEAPENERYLENPSHIYQAEGEYLVRLTVTDSAGSTATAKQTVTVSAADVLPSAYFTYTFESNDGPHINERIEFDASGSTPPGTIVQYIWNLGDGYTSVDTQPIHGHKYTEAGEKTVNLTVVDDTGATGSTSRTFTVKE
jgi:PKD repeat protein